MKVFSSGSSNYPILRVLALALGTSLLGASWTSRYFSLGVQVCYCEITPSCSPHTLRFFLHLLNLHLMRKMRGKGGGRSFGAWKITMEARAGVYVHTSHAPFLHCKGPLHCAFTEEFRESEQYFALLFPLGKFLGFVTASWEITQKQQFNVMATVEQSPVKKHPRFYCDVP